MPQVMLEPDFRYRESLAAEMMRDGIYRLKNERRISLRMLALELGYKQATVLSHMANGRIAVPLERAQAIASALQLPADQFLAAVAEQRIPGLTAALTDQLRGSRNEGGVFTQDLRVIADLDFDDLNDEQKSVLREVVGDPRPGRRWLSLAELPVVAELRTLRPNVKEMGLSELDRTRVRNALSHE